MNIQELVETAYSTAKSKGWHDKPATFGDRIALCHSELSEALEAFRALDGPSHDHLREPIYRSSMYPEHLVRYQGYYEFDLANGIDKWIPNKPEGVCSELADVVIRIADMCGLYGIDLEKAIVEKLNYNKSRSYRHGGKQL